LLIFAVLAPAMGFADEQRRTLKTWLRDRQPEQKS
jgi:hypothetical protein